jgi:hypothetical protein
MALGMQVPGDVQAGGIVGSSADDATLSKYDGLQLVTRLHATRAFIDHEKWGFFRVGLLPIFVVEGVQVQILSAGCLTNALPGLNSWNPSPGGLRRLELRNIDVSLLSEKEPRLHAATARVSQSGALELSGVSVPAGGGGPVSIPKATLQISGPAAGCLRWNDGGEQEELFIFRTVKN